MSITMKPNYITRISKQTKFIILAYIILGIGMTIICFFPLISELSYRKAHLLSTEAKIQRFRFSNRFQFAFEEFEKAMLFFPWETHYAMEYIKELEIYTKNVLKDNNQKKIYFLKILDILNRIQYIDPINPWYHSKRSSTLTNLYKLTKNQMYIRQAFKHSKIAALNDHENPIFLLNYANIIHQNNLYSEAYYYYNRALNILGSHRYVEAFYNIAEINTLYNNKEEALRLFYVVKDLNPTFRKIDGTIIRAHIALNQLDEAVEYIQLHQLQNSTQQNTLDSIAYLYLKRKDYKTSLQYLNAYFDLPAFAKKPPSNIMFQMALDNLKVLNNDDDILTFINQMTLKYPNSNIPTLFKTYLKK